jgi:hypothetical protein
MAGTLVASTINTDSGLFSTQNAYQGIAKAYVQFTGTSGAGTINASFNVSSITYNGTAGDFTVNLTTAMPSANYCVVGAASATGSSQIAFMPFTSGYAPVTPTSSAFRILTGSYTSGLSPAYICVAVFSA